MNKHYSLLTKDRNGEFIYNGLNSHICKKYKADTPLDKSFVPYLIIPLEKYVLSRLHVDNVFDIPAPCEAARRSFIKDYLDSEAGCGMNISMDRALAIASEYGLIAALRSAIQRESIERRYRHGTD